MSDSRGFTGPITSGTASPFQTGSAGPVPPDSFRAVVRLILSMGKLRSGRDTAVPTKANLATDRVRLADRRPGNVNALIGKEEGHPGPGRGRGRDPLEARMGSLPEWSPARPLRWLTACRSRAPRRRARGRGADPEADDGPDDPAPAENGLGPADIRPTTGPMPAREELPAPRPHRRDRVEELTGAGPGLPCGLGPRRRPRPGAER